MKSRLLAVGLLGIALGVPSALATTVTMKMNAVSKTMTLKSNATGQDVTVGEPENQVYTFDVEEGDYTLTAYAADGQTANGTIGFAVSADRHDFLLITCTAYVTNKHQDNSVWTIENGDYTLDVKVNTREGTNHPVTLGNSTTEGRYTFLALEGDTYTASFIPSEAHEAEGYVPLYKQGTLNWNINVNGAIPMAEMYTVRYPKDAKLNLGLKFSHYVEFTPVDPVSVATDGDMVNATYKLTKGQVYNYRTWKDGGLTQAGYFTMSADAAKRPVLEFSNADYAAYDPHAINHSVQSNGGYETGDIFVNINERNYMNMAVGESYRALALRSWQLTDNSTNNYFMEPDFHYMVLDESGKPSDKVVNIVTKPGSAWADINAVGKGTAIVLVTYDAIGVNFYNNSGVKTPYMGGEYWGAIWPENTAAYVITVGQTESTVKPEMVINEAYNSGNLKNAGKYVDAEHDVFYYLDTEEGHTYTFTPQNAASVTMAYPSIGERMATYTGFGSEGVTANQDGSYTLLLKEGRQIVRLTDAAGNSTYQVLTAKTCHREVINVSRPGSSIFQPGDEVKIQFSGLRHPANKMSAIYNMSAYVTYNGVPNGTSLILSANQYTFGSVASAQAVSVTIPDDFDADRNKTFDMTDGVIQVNGYGDPIGNHRIINYQTGRNPNFTAVAHKTYFGAIPETKIPVTKTRTFRIEIIGAVEDADVSVEFDGKPLVAEADGFYSGTYGDYNVVAVKSGYRYYHHTFNIGDDADGTQYFDIDMVAAPDAWDGVAMVMPERTPDGAYVIRTPAELAWFADHINAGQANNSDAIQVQDIDLGDYPWTPIGTTASKSFTKKYTGCGHSVNGVYVNNPETDYQGLFGYVKGTSGNPAQVTGLTVSGEIIGRNYVGAVAGNLQYAVVDTCANHASVTGVQRVGGIVGNMSDANSKVQNCYNTGAITGSGYHAGIVGQMANANGRVTNVFNVGDVEENANGAACVGGTVSKSNVTNSYAILDYAIASGSELVTGNQMASGEVAYKLGNAFGQKIGTNAYPVFGGEKVYYDGDSDTYYNIPTAVETVTIVEDEIRIYYNLHGIASDEPWDGLNIVLLKDGTTRKVYYRK